MQIFEPFSLRSELSQAAGLGLGLYIVSEIARAHEGNLEVSAQGNEVCFCFRIPRNSSAIEGAPSR